MPATEAPTEVIPLPPERPRRRTTPWLAAVVVVVVAAAGSAFVLARHRAGGEPVARETAKVATVKLQRRDLSTTRSLPGSIGYGAARALAGHTEATVTWLPAVGATVKRGRQLFRADDEPVVLFYGSMPLYRLITGRNLVGRDVRIIADNLKALGYAIGRQPSRVTATPEAGAKAGAQVWVEEDEAVLTAGLVEAIKKWQRHLSRPVTGQVAVGDVEVLSGAVRVDSVAVQPGGPANAPLMSVTPTRKVITVSADLTDAAAVNRGDRVTVTLPDDRTVKARVVAVGRTLAVPEGGAGTGSPQLTVSVVVDEPRTIARLDSADVQVNFPGRTVRKALAAPVEALIALTEGGYAVQGPNGLVGVRTGMFAGGWVEVTGAGLAEDMDLVVAS